MCLAFRLCNQAIDRQNISFHLCRQSECGNNLFDVPHPTVVVMRGPVPMAVPMLMFVFMMLMVMQILVFFLSIHLYRNVSPGDAAFHGLLPDELHAGYAQTVQFREKSIRLRQQLQQSCCQHISGGSHATVQV